MIKQNHNLSLDFYYNEEKTVNTKQYDKDSRYITIYPTYKGQEYTISKDKTKAKIKWLKPDNTAVYNDCIINDANNTITVEMTEQMSIVSGVAKATISLYDIQNNQVLSSTSFNAIVEASAYSNDEIISSDEFEALNKMILDEDERIKAVNALNDLITTNETTRNQNETDRQTNEATRQTNEEARVQNEKQRISNETTRNANETNRQTNTATAISNAEKATSDCIDATTDLQNRLDAHHFVLTEDKDIADGVPSLDLNTKVPIVELYEATTTSKGITQLTDSVSSTSTTTAATPNSVKTAYDKTVSLNTGITGKLNDEITRAKSAEQALINIIDSNKPIWNDKYTKNEVDNKFSTLETNIDWKESVATFHDIASAYPNPQDGWTVNVKDTDYTYRYSGTQWVAISANAIPKATQSVDGLLTAADKRNYDDANTKKHTHSNKSVLDGLTSSLITAWNNAVAHISDTVSHITVSERSLWNTVGNKVDKISGKGLSANDYTTAEKNKLSGIADNANNYSLPTATASTFGGVKTGSNITNSSGIISLTAKNVTDALGYTPGNASGSVTGVKGNAESSYRTGNVNMTPANIGALPASGGTITGALNFANGTWNAVGDDVAIGNMDVAGTLGVKGLNGSPNIRLVDTDNHFVGDVVHSGNIGSQSVNYANSAGTVNGHSVNKDVPGNAVFTDTNTTYSAGAGISLWGTTFSNSGVRNIATGSTNGTISVNTNGTTANVAVKGLGSAAYTASGAYAAADHTHSYLPLSGGNLTGVLSINPGSSASTSYGSIDLYKANQNSLSIFGGNDVYSTAFGGTVRANNGNLYFVVPDNRYFDFNKDIHITGNIIKNGWLNAQVANAFQVRNVDDTAWMPIQASNVVNASSKRYKKNVVDMPEEQAKKILEYRVVDYDYINEADGTNCQGMIAEEVAEVDEYPVYRTPDGEVEGLDYSRFVPQLIKMVQLQQAQIEQLQKEVAELI